MQGVLSDGADGIAVELCDLPPEQRTAENFRRLMDAVHLPFMFILYRNDRWLKDNDEERQKFTELLDAGFIDTFRYFYPDQTGIYSWWSYRFSARAKNAGWRIDYFCVSESLKDRLVDAKILTDVMGSDHCPVELDIK